MKKSKLGKSLVKLEMQAYQSEWRPFSGLELRSALSGHTGEYVSTKALYELRVRLRSDLQSLEIHLVEAISDKLERETWNL